MRKSFNLREVKKSDWKVLLKWRNDNITRQNFFNSDLISVSEHKEYIKNTINNPNRTQFILEYNEIPVGTIREDRLDKGEFELSYTISPMYRGKKIGQIIMSLYLIERKGSFLCEVKEENIPSIKMIEKLGFKLFNTEKKVNLYKLNQS
ncbi:MAG: GNAT family N-acetyltransferase [Flavobacteriaceae bacterium]|jgi:RimJ/RimL family protein N-acetyltransferase|nr:GNAT family N-acetyltransferase [Flavobacteriaceae bacterium]